MHFFLQNNKNNDFNFFFIFSFYFTRRLKFNYDTFMHENLKIKLDFLIDLLFININWLFKMKKKIIYKWKFKQILI